MSTEANTKDPGSEPAALSHRERSEATRARILEAARSQFVANGLEGTRMEAIATEAGFGQPSRGATRRIRSSPKFHIARAAAPMFSPICGRTSTMAGIGAGWTGEVDVWVMRAS